jgi:hypothetical protein
VVALRCADIDLTTGRLHGAGLSTGMPACIRWPGEALRNAPSRSPNLPRQTRYENQASISVENQTDLLCLPWPTTRERGNCPDLIQPQIVTYDMPVRARMACLSSRRTGGARAP